MKLKCNKCGKVFNQEPEDVIILICEECRKPSPGRTKMTGIDEREKTIKDLREKGMTFKKIGEKFGISGNRVSQILHNIKRKEKRHELLKEKAGTTEIIYLPVSVRLYNALKEKNILDLKDTEKMTDFELLSIKNIGKRTLCEIRSLEKKYIHGTGSEGL